MIDDTSTIPASGSQATTVAFANLFTASNTSTTITNVEITNILTLSGAMTANTAKTMLNLSGQGGKIPVLAVRTKDATARTIKLHVTLDGYLTTITSNSISGANVGIIACGQIMAAGLSEGEPLKWKTSILVQIESNLTETDKIELIYKRMQEA